MSPAACADPAAGSPPLRVTVVSSYGTVGGAELWLLDLLDATTRLDVEAVLLGTGPLASELADRGVRCRVLPAGRNPATLVAPALRMARQLRRGRPDVVLANGFKAGLVAGLAGRLAGVRVVWATHDHSFDGYATGVLASLVDGVLASSPALAAASGHPRAMVVPPPRASTRPLPRAEARRELSRLGMPPDGNVLGLVGRLVAYKGGADAVVALADPAATRWRLAVIGADDPAAPGERARLTRLAHEHGVADRVHFLGAVPRARSLFAGFDALAVLTRADGAGPDREGFGITALEAMVAGVPVVTTGPGPVAERLGGRAGLVVPPADPTAVTVALARLAEPAERKAMGAAGVELSADHPTAPRCADALAAHLAEVAHRPGAGLTGTAGITIVVTVLDEATAIDELLATLRPQLRLPADELMIVDGGSTDGTADRVRQAAAADPRIRLLCRPGAGISAGRNAGITEAGNDLVVCTDAGCTPTAGWLEAMRAAAADVGAPELLTGVYRVCARGPLEAAMAAVGYPEPAELRHPSLLVRGYGRLLGRTFDAEMPTGRSIGFTRQAWARAGGFPEHLDTGEDVLFGRAVARDGGAVLVADAEVGWAQRPTLRSTARMYFRYGEGSGRSRDRRLLARDLARLGTYLLAPLVAATGRTGRLAVGVGALAYLSLPLSRALRAPRPLMTVAAVPVAAAVRDLAKATGCVAGLRATSQNRGF